METKNLDVVYIVRPGENEELRYSLRSLKNLDFSGRVWVYGQPPKWLTCDIVPHTQTGIGKWNKTRSSLDLVMRNEQISKQFILFNDDMFILKPIKEIPYYTTGTLNDYWHNDKFLVNGRLSDYARRLAYTDKFFPGGFNYELHIPFVLDKELLRKLRRKYQFGATRSLYGNQWKVKPVLTKDVKIYDLDEKIPRGAVFVSTTDLSFANGQVGKSIRRRLSEPSRFEKTE